MIDTLVITLSVVAFPFVVFYTAKFAACGWYRGRDVNREFKRRQLEQKKEQQW